MNTICYNLSIPLISTQTMNRNLKCAAAFLHRIAYNFKFRLGRDSISNKKQPSINTHGVNISNMRILKSSVCNNLNFFDLMEIFFSFVI